MGEQPQPQSWEEVFEATIEDYRLTRSERRALRLLFDAKDLNEQSRGMLRHQAFAMARKTTVDADTASVLDWLEDVIKLLLTPAEESGPESRVYFSPNDDCARAIEMTLGRTRNAADICVFTITDDRITRAILDAARRGVAVRIITDDEKSQDRGSDITELAGAGIPIRQDRSPYHMHHKFAVFDRTTILTGSYNWTRGAANYNQENLVITEDQKLSSAFEREFERLWQQWSD